MQFQFSAKSLVLKLPWPDTIPIMNFTLSSHVLMAHWAPGFVVVMAIRPLLLNGSSAALKSLVGLDPLGGAIAILAVVVAAFIIGEVLDASRDLLENVWDWFQPVEWDFFAKAKKDEVESFRTSYFTYYVFDCNVSLALFILLALAWRTSFFPVWAVLILALFLIIFLVNAWRLRGEVASVTQSGMTASSAR